MTTIRANAEQYLREGFNQVEGYTFCEYVNEVSIADEGFFRWFFEDSEIENFGSNLTEEQKNAYSDFIENLK